MGAMHKTTVEVDREAVAEAERNLGTRGYKETINRAYETSLSEGVRFERRVFHSQFAVADQKEGMAAFIEKRKAKFEHK